MKANFKIVAAAALVLACSNVFADQVAETETATATPVQYYQQRSQDPKEEDCSPRNGWVYAGYSPVYVTQFYCKKTNQLFNDYGKCYYNCQQSY